MEEEKVFNLQIPVKLKDLQKVAILDDYDLPHDLVDSICGNTVVVTQEEFAEFGNTNAGLLGLSLAALCYRHIRKNNEKLSE